MRRSHMLFIPSDGAKTQLLGSGRWVEQKALAKKFVRSGMPDGRPGVIELYLSPSALGEASFLKFRVPAVAPPIVEGKISRKFFAKTDNKS